MKIPPTLRILRQVAIGKSFYRASLNLIAEQRVILKGTVLDLGAGEGPSYWNHILTNGCKVIRCDLQPHPRCHLVLNLETPLPLKKASMDVILLFNVLEHVYNHKNLLTETYRLLKPGGTVFLAAPFLHRIHAHPHDYFRYSAEALKKLSAETGFKEFDLQLCGAGLFKAMYTFVPFRTSLIRYLLGAMVILLDKLATRTRSYYTTDFPLGYFCTLRK